LFTHQRVLHVEQPDPSLVFDPMSARKHGRISADARINNPTEMTDAALHLRQMAGKMMSTDRN
jgi:hypothetical protein